MDEGGSGLDGVGAYMAVTGARLSGTQSAYLYIVLVFMQHCIYYYGECCSTVFLFLFYSSCLALPFRIYRL